jgi:uncharacterized membrane protein YeaQ/YmgE (transglycosylase-associated protein family)
MEIILLLLFWPIFGIVGSLILSRSPAFGCLLGVLLGPLGWVIALILRINDQAKERELKHQVAILTSRQDTGPERTRMNNGSNHERECPYCAEWIKIKAIVCRYCNREVPPAEDALSTPEGPQLDFFRTEGVRYVEITTANDSEVCQACNLVANRSYEIDAAPRLPICENCRCEYDPA